MHAPFEHLSGSTRRLLIATTLFGVIGLGAFMLDVGRPMDRAGHSILAFELAGTPEKVETILTDWGVAGRDAARRQTVLDFGWIVLYATCLSLALSHLAGRIRHPHFDERMPTPGFRHLASVAAVLAWGALLAGVLDAVENTLLLAELDGARGAAPRVAAVCAAVKLALLAAGIVVVVVGFSARAIAARR